ncbi:NAD(P)H-flavin reductase [Orrella marina]|uniref:NAD(P)H-flavin reductase n=1 Tax=Orrella marina TaxID=2163011 RepID=A0A2R4XGW5_9BURK|nr:NAD(P)H-flavin reductase [Orrella marina]
MPIVRLSSGAEFESSADSPILDEASRSNITLPYSCKSGRCSTCKCKVLSGTTFALHPETGLTDQEKSAGWILSCVRSAQTDVALEVEELGGVILPSVKTFPCRISHLERLAPDVLQVKLRLPPTADFEFIPGQYVDLIGPNGVRRSYSLANSGMSGKVLELHVRAVNNGVMSDYLFNTAKINDLLRLNGPLGTFFLRNTADLDLIFLATGTGIAPVKAILESLKDQSLEQQPRSVTVLWGGRSPQDLYLDVANITQNITFWPVLSRAGTDWKGARGHVQQVLMNLDPDLTNTVVYACGSNVMIDSARGLLIKNGLPLRRFYSDAFVSSSS